MECMLMTGGLALLGNMGEAAASDCDFHDSVCVCV